MGRQIVSFREGLNKRIVGRVERIYTWEIEKNKQGNIYLGIGFLLD